MNIPAAVPIVGTLLILGSWIINLLLHIRRQERKVKRLQAMIVEQEGVNIFDD